MFISPYHILNTRVGFKFRKFPKATCKRSQEAKSSLKVTFDGTDRPSSDRDGQKRGPADKEVAMSIIVLVSVLSVLCLIGMAALVFDASHERVSAPD